jgi:hypothetical protein
MRGVQLEVSDDVLEACRHICDVCDIEHLCLHRPCYREVRRGPSIVMGNERPTIARELIEASHEIVRDDNVDSVFKRSTWRTCIWKLRSWLNC